MIKLMSPDCDGNCSGCASANPDGSCGASSGSGIQKCVPNKSTKIKKVIGVVSGKGGVGKSFVTSLLASYLNKEGKKVGILDGDIVGPSIPKSFNIHSQAYGNEDRLIVPAETLSGIKLISSNMMLEHEDDPIIWRGSLVSSLLKQFYTDVAWGELEVLLIDMPPGTSDVPLTAFQSLPLDGIVVVTTPQELVGMVVDKAINMAKAMNIKVLGIVENMSYVECPNCGEKIYVFGESHVDETAEKYGLDVLARVPLDGRIAKMSDAGTIEELKVTALDPAADVIEKL